MKIKFISPSHPPVAAFDEVTLEDFTIFVGRNGSGKTKLLKAIAAGACSIDDFSPNQVRYFSPLEFKLDAQNGFPEPQVKQRLKQAWTFFLGQSGNPKKNYKNIAQSILNQHLQLLNCKDLDPTVRSALLFGDGSHDPDPENTKRVRHAYLSEIDKQVLAPLSKINDGKALCRALVQTQKLISSVTEADLEGHFSPDSKPHNLLGASLGTVFSRYRVQQFRWVQDQQQLHNSDKTFMELQSLYEANNPKPWDRVNELFATMNDYSDVETVFNFEVTDPGQQTVDYRNVDSFVFSAQVRDKISGETYGFDALSSGEMVLATLALSLFQSEETGWQPKVLLLDEIDASLHPSMTKALLETIRRSFVDQDIKVILATHSPSTVAISDPEQLREVNVRSDAVVSKVSQEKAVDILSDGIATLSGASLVYGSITQPINILTEGKNTIHIRRLLELHNMTDVGIAEGLENVTSCSQLKTYADFLKIFPLDAYVIVAFDPDAKKSFGKTDETDRVKKFIFKKHPNASKKCGGIEGVFCADLIEPMLAKTEGTFTDGHYSKTISELKLTDSAKRRIEKQMSQYGTKQNYEGFDGLVKLIEELRSQPVKDQTSQDKQSSLPAG